ncbi:MAG: hypothetical protein KY392_00705 [Chloroflexi bacterium]|nr:hypothetical protein [Chloroflexota bacterium]
MQPTDFVADFDSASAMLRATAAGLRGRDFANLGVESPLEHVAGLVNRLPDGLKEQVYIWSGAAEAVDPGDLDQLDEQAIARTFVAEYPRRTYPAVLIGSSNGAAVHLATALDAPWLPQTWFVPVRRDGVHPDEPLDDLEWSREPAARLLAANPDLQLHHMHDPNQDRLMVQRLTYFRVKRRTLGEAYERFLLDHLEPGGTIVLVENTIRWPVIRVGDRHVFQPGATGGIEPHEYLHGSERVRDYLERYGSPHRRWDFGEPNDEAPEAEWGFEPMLRDDVLDFADDHGFAVERLTFEEPEDLSPAVADLYRWWYTQRGLGPVRLLAESFILMEPIWALRTGSAPYWCKFSTLPSVEKLERYVDLSGPWEELMIMLFPHGTEGAGLANPADWRRLMDRVGAGRFLGVDEDAFPRDFAGLREYHTALVEAGERFPLPDHHLTLDQVRDFLSGRRERMSDTGPSPVLTERTVPTDGGVG